MRFMIGVIVGTMCMSTIILAESAIQTYTYNYSSPSVLLCSDREANTKLDKLLELIQIKK